MYSLSGFSLLELMIVIAIVGILAMFAIPSYQGYTKRARFAEVISAAQVYKTAVAIALQQGIVPAELKNGEHGIPAEPSATKNLEDITVENGIITATGSEKVNNATYILTPDPGGSHFVISGTCVEAGLCSD